MKNNAVLAAGSEKLAGSLADFLSGSQEVPEIEINLEDIAVRAQVRETFEDQEDGQSLADLGKSLRKRQLQAIVVRPDPRGEKPYELVIGGRRYRGARIEGMTSLRGIVLELSDEEAEEAQFAENIHRLNLTQLEEAKRLKRDLEQLGGVEAVLAKHNKSKSWLSKRLALLDLGPQATRLINENLTADKEVIGKVRTIERADPAKAKEVVDKLSEKGRGGDTRNLVDQAKHEVKPSTRKPVATPAAKKESAGQGGDALATPRDRAHEAPSEGTVSIFPEQPHQRVLRQAWKAVVQDKAEAAEVVAKLPAWDAEAATKHLQRHFEKGAATTVLVQGIVAGLRDQSFGPEGEQALALAAFVQGFAKWPALDLAEALKALHSS